MNTTTTNASAWRLPTRRAAWWFGFRVAAHVVRRALIDALPWRRIRRHATHAGQLADAPVVAELRSPLWTDGRPDEFALVAGKVHNLRLACAAFDGVVVPAGQVLSFWRQLGRPVASRGFVLGREVKSGCVVPTVAGGLCQLSNALASAAVRAGITLAERHGHTARIEQAAAPGDGQVDATVFWNYLDLRLVAGFDFRVEAALTQDELVLRLRALSPAEKTAENAAVSPPVKRARSIALRPVAADAPVARGCMTCDEQACFRHGRHDALPVQGKTAVLVDGWSPEWAAWLEANEATADWRTPWVRAARRGGGHWPSAGVGSVEVIRGAAWRRMLALRWQASVAQRVGLGEVRQAVVTRTQAWLAAAMARRLRPEHTRLVVDQGLLVPLARSGQLGGRRYEVLASALPAGELQQRLDAARAACPPADALGTSLADFRVDDAYCRDEIAALRGADRVVTPHHEVARCLQSLGVRQVALVDWVLPNFTATSAPFTRPPRHEGEVPTVVFPASALPRKGVLELAAALRVLRWRLLVLGTPAEDASLWDGIAVEHGRFADLSWLQQADVVVLPAHVEHAPRALLLALAHGLPVVATPACGLPAAPGLTTVPPGDAAALIEALRRAVALKG